MKRLLTCATLALACSLSLPTEAKHHSPNNGPVTVYSDTTGNSTAGSTTYEEADDQDPDDRLEDALDRHMDSMMNAAFNHPGNQDAEDTGSSQFILKALLIIFGIPALLIALIIYFIYRSRRAKYDMQRMAYEKGISPATSQEKAYQQNASSQNYPDKLWEKGVRQTCLGIGLFILLWLICDSFAVGCTGILVMCIGIGNIVIARKRRKKDEDFLKDEGEEYIREEQKPTDTPSSPEEKKDNQQPEA